MKKICFIDFDMTVVGGVEQVTVSLANALCDKYKVYILSFCGEGLPKFPLDSRVHYTTFNLKQDRLRNMRKSVKPLLKKYLYDNNIDVAFAQGNYPAFVAGGVCGSVKTKMIFCDHGALINQWNEREAVLIRLFCSIQYKKTVTLTEQNLNDYRKKFKTSKRKLVHITNWIADDLPKSSEYDIKSKKIVSAGRFGKEKGFDMLIKAFAPVAKKHPDWQLDLFGDGEMMDTVKSLINEYGINGNVNLLGMRSDLKERYGDYAMYVLPSYREGVPLVLMEAKANRLPIVSFDIMTGPREIVRDGVDGILIPPYDLDKMADAMCSLIEDDNLRNNMSERSQENIEKFSKSAILKQWCELIESLN